MNKSKNFYNTLYHFEEDIRVGLDYKRIKNYFKDVKLKPRQKYLDIGCGVGWALRYHKEKGAIPFGIDISEKALKLSKTIPGIAPYVVIADGQFLPFNNDSFNLVSALGTIEHFDSPGLGLCEIKRVVKQYGKVVIVVPNSYGFLNKLGLYRGTEQEQEMMATLPEWIKFIRRHGFEIVKINKDIGPRILKNKKLLGIVKRTLVKLTFFMPKIFTYCFIFTCRKKH